MKINEIYGPVKQGEGKSLGRWVVFVRLALCNLACVWCDTPYTWNWKGTKFQHPDKYDPDEEIHEVLTAAVAGQVLSLGQKVRAVVFSGGEPLLQQRELVPICALLQMEGFWIEIETNGTVVPTAELLDVVNQINCSPKLQNSGPDNKKTMRIKDRALQQLASSEKVNFKFVVATDDDVQEIVELVDAYNLKEVYLMPEGRTKEELLRHEASTRKICAERGFHFSPRQHIIDFGNVRGV